MDFENGSKTLVLTLDEFLHFADDALLPEGIAAEPCPPNLPEHMTGFSTDKDIDYPESATPFSLRLTGVIPRFFLSPPEATLEFFIDKKSIAQVHPFEDRATLLRALLCGFIVLSRYGLLGATVRLTFRKEETDKKKSFDFSLSREQLQHFYSSILSSALPFLSFVYKHETETKPALDEMKFPFNAPRSAQKELILETFRAIKKKASLVACAPTGVGKTMGVLYPALKALAQNETDKIFYLTAKTVTGKAAADAVKVLSKQVPSLKAIPIYGKERFCPRRPEHGRPMCFGCPLANESEGLSFRRRTRLALLELLNDFNVFEPETILFYAKKYSLCPYELSLEISEWCDVVICDYNYVFDPQMRFRRYFGDDALCRAPLLLVDEAHNLPDRAREIYSVSLSTQTLAGWQNQYHTLAPDDPAFPLLLHAMNDVLLTLGELTNDNRQDDFGFYVDTQPPRLLEKPAAKLLEESRKRLFQNPTGEAASLLSDIYADAKKLLTVLAQFDDHYRLYIEQTAESILVRCLCLDPSALLKQKRATARASVFFSATLSPLPYYADLFGCPEAVQLDLPSPYLPENFCLLAADYISTRFADRLHTADGIADAILAMADGKEGHYLAYFSSYQFVKSVGRILLQKAPHLKLIVQRKEMTIAERSRFLHEFDTPPKKGETVLGLCVLGGIFSEGIDLKGDALIGVAVVGIGLGSLTSESNLLQEYFEATRESGKEYAYIYPGINRILQAGGRVIRDEKDRGVVLLIDDRYDDPGIQKLLPQHWNHLRFVGNEESLEAVVRAFWSR